ncbi:MAG: hypothetical protein HYX78_15775 [Armatimonadetes bacterium]|nr:hypothetical protein [Armatimonadota bacterium]
MKRHIILFTSATLMACLLYAQAYAAKDAKTLYYEVKMKSPLGDLGTRKMYVKGSNFAWEYITSDLSMRFVKNDDGAFLIHPFKRFVGKYPPGSNRESPMTFLPAPAGDVKAFLKNNDAKKQHSEKMNGKPCDIYAYTEKKSGWKCQLWVEPKKYTPVKLIMKGKEKGNEVTVTYLSYKLGVQVADSHFELPKGLPVRMMPDRKSSPGGAEPDSPEIKKEASGGTNSREESGA